MRTGQITHCVGARKTTGLFLELLEALDTLYPPRWFTRLSIVVDNAKVQHARAVTAWLAAHPRIELLFLPTYCPQANPIERAFGDVHDKCTRNHTRKRLCDLVTESVPPLAPIYNGYKFPCIKQKFTDHSVTCCTNSRDGVGLSRELHFQLDQVSLGLALLGIPLIEFPEIALKPDIQFLNVCVVNAVRCGQVSLRGPKIYVQSVDVPSVRSPSFSSTFSLRVCADQLHSTASHSSCDKTGLVTQRARPPLRTNPAKPTALRRIQPALKNPTPRS